MVDLDTPIGAIVGLVSSLDNTSISMVVYQGEGVTKNSFKGAVIATSIKGHVVGMAERAWNRSLWFPQCEFIEGQYISPIKELSHETEGIVFKENEKYLCTKILQPEEITPSYNWITTKNNLPKAIIRSEERRVGKE